jgi:murein DD-endopeptidase MepM/ murein hydrolase activator NlpD
MLPLAIPPVTPPVVLHAYRPAAHDWLPAHRGVDLVARPGQPVRAVRAGTVVVSRVIAGRPVVVLRSRGIRFTFEPVSGTVPVDTRVARGKVIGRVATGGHCGDTCLHWGAKTANGYVDPWFFLRSAPVLKPMR